MRRWLILASLGLTLCAAGVATYLLWAPKPKEALFLDLSVNYYTRHASAPARSQSIDVQVSTLFATAERALIQDAIREWNHVLNGHIILVPREGTVHAAAFATPDPAGDALPPWKIERVNNLPKPAGAAPVAVTVGLPGAPVVILVMTNRLGAARLDRVMLHEIGHALGLAHDPNGHLMQEQYRGNEQICVDKIAVTKLAALKGLPLGQLNWCTY